MRIRALVHIAGQGFALAPGDVTDRFTEAEALRLVAKRAAVAVDPAPQIERMVDEPAAVEIRGGKRKGKRG